MIKWVLSEILASAVRHKSSLTFPLAGIAVGSSGLLSARLEVSLANKYVCEFGIWRSLRSFGPLFLFALFDS